MDPRQIQLVQTSFARLAGDADGVARAFYARLFAVDPGLRPMFKHDMSAQRHQLMQMLAAAVNGLDDLESLLPTVTALGARHGRYGVRGSHYAAVGQALIDTLRAGLGDDFTPACEQAWTAVHAALSDAMQTGAQVAARAKAHTPTHSVF
jgi:hemoglobin-like flavoprotein